MTATPKLGLERIASGGQEGAEVLYNTSVNLLDFLVQPRVINMDTNAQPASPSEGDFYIIGPTPTGAQWSGNAGKLAMYSNGWIIRAAAQGLKVYNLDDSKTYVYDGAAWVEDAGGGGGSTTLAGLSDVDLSGLAANSVLVYDGASDWVAVSGLSAAIITTDQMHPDVLGDEGDTDINDEHKVLHRDRVYREIDLRAVRNFRGLLEGPGLVARWDGSEWRPARLAWSDIGTTEKPSPSALGGGATTPRSFMSGSGNWRGLGLRDTQELAGDGSEGMILVRGPSGWGQRLMRDADLPTLIDPRRLSPGTLDESDLAAIAGCGGTLPFGRLDRLTPAAEPSPGLMLPLMNSARVSGTVVSGRVYFVYLGRVSRREILDYLQFELRTVGTGTQDAEVAVYSGDMPPGIGWGATLTKLAAVELTSGAEPLASGGARPVYNTTPLAADLQPGTHVYAALRIAMGSTQPQLNFPSVEDAFLGFNTIDDSGLGKLTDSATDEMLPSVLAFNTTSPCPRIIGQLRRKD